MTILNFLDFGWPPCGYEIIADAMLTTWPKSCCHSRGINGITGIKGVTGIMHSRRNQQVAAKSVPERPDCYYFYAHLGISTYLQLGNIYISTIGYIYPHFRIHIDI